ncbi:DUF3073 family protein [Acrocarpospora phusangensis]|uniref:DUF3073 family protein n=1 Tax=Acrocarpospora phusangensis TaxID=1070424 RepID=UPI001950959C|nr:DUF3073 family protein [Acrocarpospora phusangensis]
MGRGRAKAKQVKVARALKYRDGGDLESLRRELGVQGAPAARTDVNATADVGAETEQGPVE